MNDPEEVKTLALPKGWTKHVQSSVLHLLSLARFVIVTAHGQAIVPMAQNQFREECVLIFDWYNEHRPHMTLNGKTPNEVYSKEKFPANRRPSIEPRKDWPRRSRCAKPQTLVAGQPGDRFSINIELYKGRQHLPTFTLNRAA